MAQHLTTNFAQTATRSNPNDFMGGGKYLQASLQHISSIMLALLLSVLVNVSAFGQHFASYPSNDEYGQHALKQYKVADGAQYSSTDPAANVTMNTLAANGYGQWTVSTNLGGNVEISGHQWLFSPNQSGVNFSQSWSPNNSTAWMLLGNLITKPSENYNSGSTSTHPGCQPPGIVSGGSFNTTGGTAFPVSACKVAANLNGSVRYVGVEPTNRQSFFIQGLNDERGATSGPGGDQQIRVELNNSTDILPNGPVARQIVRNPIFSYTTINSNTVDNSEADFRDVFDIAMDKKYLYIVWVSIVNSIAEVWSTAIKLSDGTVATGFPVKLANGTRPTVACDVRNDPAVPQFAAAWLNGGNVKVASYDVLSNVVTVVKPTSGTPETLPKKYKDPVSSIYPDNTFTSNFTHARVLVSSVVGAAAITSVYAIQPDALLHYNNITFNPTTDVAWYVDGVQPYVGTSPPFIPFPSPIPQTTSGTNNSCTGVLDKHIIAFANPYDNQSGTFNQFHCLYQLEVSNFGKNPLVMVRGADNGFGQNPNGNTDDTRLVVNQEGGSTVQSDPSSYVGAVNQMGIHVHWRISSDHHYLRDTRAFDEPIEEHTLATNICKIADGSSHGGSSGGAELKSGVKMTVWSDPNYGAINGGSTTSGMYWRYPTYISPDGVFLGQDNIGTLSYATTSLALTVGNSAGTATATLFTMPVCNIAKTGSAGTLTINKGSTWEYFGTSIYSTGNWSSPYWGVGNMTINLNGPSTGPTSPNLKIHGGATFWECASLNGTDARIDILFEANISPISGGPNASASGLLRTGKTATLTTCKVNSFLPYSTWNDDYPNVTNKMTNAVMHIVGTGDGGYSTPLNLNSTGTDYTNFANISDVGLSAGGGVGIILYDGPGCTDDAGLNRVKFDDGTFTQMRIHAINPRNGGLHITDNTFDNLDNEVILIERVCEWDYANILIEGNSFESILDVDDYNPQHCIVIDGFNNDNHYGEVEVIDNNWTFVGNDRIDHYMQGAIMFINSTGNIIGNNVTGYPFAEDAAIKLTAVLGVEHYSYLCSNVLNDVSTGIKSDHYGGYIKLCELTENGYGMYSGLLDRPKLVNTEILNSTGYGIYVEGSLTSTDFALVDLSGVHGSSDDYAGYNTIAHFTDNGQEAEVYLEGDQLIHCGEMNSAWDFFGENNFIGTDLTPGLILTGGATDIGNIDNNYWDRASGYENPYTATPGTIFGTDLDFSGSTYLFAETVWSGSISCSGGFGTKPKDVTPQSMPLDYDTCARLKEWMYYDTFTQEEAKMKYDSLRTFIEKCAATDPKSYYVFGAMSGAVQRYAPNDTMRFIHYREWLISVMYLNTTEPAYFCNVVSSIAGTYQYGKYYPTLAYLAVIDYLRKHTNCTGLGHDKEFTKDSLYAVNHGYDPTNLPPLDSLGLGFLLKLDVPHEKPALSSMYLGSASVVPNPMSGSTTLTYELLRTGFIGYTVHDALGNQVLARRSDFADAGKHEEQITLPPSLSAGTYYLRLNVGFGEIRTIRMVVVK